MGAIILAGGQSRRMGQDKAQLRFQEVSLLERAVRTVSELTTEIFVVCAESSQYSLSQGKIVLDRFPGEGPLGGIITGLAVVGEGWHWVLACDMPLLKASVLRALLTSAKAGACAVVPEIDGRLEPLCALYHHTALPLLQAEFESGQRALHRAVRRLPPQIVYEAELRNLDPTLESLININTPEEFLALTSEQSAEERGL